MSFVDFTANLKEMNITGAKAEELDGPEPAVRFVSCASGARPNLLHGWLACFVLEPWAPRQQLMHSMLLFLDL